MKRILLYVLPILIIIAAVFTVFGILQIRSEEDKLTDDLSRKVRAVAESLELTAKHALAGNDQVLAQRLADSFQNRERLQGCVVYDNKAETVAVTPRIAFWQRQKAVVQSVLQENSVRAIQEAQSGFHVYRYLLPVSGDDNKPLGAIEVVYDTSYMYGILAEFWRRLSLTLIILIVLIGLTAGLLQRQIFILPVRRLTEWFKYFQKGETDRLKPFEAKGEFGKLVSEIEQVALSLRVARRVVTDEAQARTEKREFMTETKLRDLIHAKLGDNALFVVSNREPYMHIIDKPGQAPRCTRPASGVVTAIDPILRACGGTWIAQGSGNADRQFVNSKNKLGVPPEDNRYILKRVWLTEEEERGYYYGFANEGLWPLCHVTHTRPTFRENDWQMYKKANLKFAASILEELPAKDPFVFIQDYHFTLLPLMLRESRPDIKIALFWHIPWPNPEVFAICPYQQEILEGMLACDLIGFHLQFHCNNFLDTVNRLTESRVDAEKFSVIRGNRETLIRAFPISVDGYFDSTGDDRSIFDRAQGLRDELGLKGMKVALGVDRIDYTKGIIERLLALERFLEKYPEQQGKIVFVQLAAPSRTFIKRYYELALEINERVEKINLKFGRGDWKPVIYRERHFSSQEIRPYYRMADICIVSSLHDGMNLVAKEYVASKTESDGVLVLSRFTGASRELTDAVLVNPYSIEEFADAINEAVVMPEETRKKKMENMRRQVSENNVYRWAANIITELTGLKKGP